MNTTDILSKKPTVVLLCHYWSDEMATMVGTKHYFRELSPWIQETLNLFKNKQDIELHVVAPNYASNDDLNVSKDNIFYHFYRYSPKKFSAMLVPWCKLVVNHAEIFKVAERLANVLTGFRMPPRSALKIIHGIQPELIHLYGSENPDYSSVAVKLLADYPMLLTVQGYAYRQQKSRNPLERLFWKYRVCYEETINRQVPFMTSSSQTNLEELKSQFQENLFFQGCKKKYFVNAITKIPQVNALTTKKKYDVVFYARIDKNKGIEDLLEAIKQLCKEGRNLKVLIMGRGNEEYIQMLKDKIQTDEIEKNIDFLGFVESHEEVYRLAAQSKVMVLPSHNDGIPNTIREAMFMRLPVVANNIGGIPRFNENRHCIHLVEKGNIQDLKEGVVKVLDEEGYRNTLIENSYAEAQEMFSPEGIYGQLVAAYWGVYEQSNGWDNASKTKRH